MSPDELVELLLFEFDAEIAARIEQRERAKDSVQRALYFYNLLRSNPEVPDEYHVEERFKHAAKLLAAFDAPSLGDVQ
jgi:GrpB-like predicted nucleotidyltransferase (UPF0157 family)